MDITNAIKNRRSVRKYQNKEVTKDLIKEILECARWAPSGLNNQPWKFKIITDEAIKNELGSFTQYRRIIEEAPACICVFLDKKTLYNREKDIMAIGACVQNMLLKAYDLGLGGCWLGEILIKKEAVHKFLNTYPDFELMAIVTLGFPRGRNEETERKDLRELMI